MLEKRTLEKFLRNGIFHAIQRMADRREGKKRTISLWLPQELENVCVRKVVDCLILHNLIEIIIIFKCGFVVLINYKHMVCKMHAARVN